MTPDVAAAVERLGAQADEHRPLSVVVDPADLRTILAALERHEALVEAAEDVDAWLRRGMSLLPGDWQAVKTFRALDAIREEGESR